MSSRGKQIRLYLVDGHAAGLMTAEIVNWTGKLIVVPRTELASFANRGEARRPGVYLLIGPDPEKATKDRLYIGESDAIVDRLASHDRDPKKDYWQRAIVAVSKDENLTKAHVKYLESHLLSLATIAARATLDNGTSPEPNMLPEADVADMEYFLDQLQLVLPVLGVSHLQPVLRSDSRLDREESPLFVMSPVGTLARMRIVDGEFVVLRGSTARKQPTASWTSYRGLRDQLVADGKLRDGGGYYEFTEDVPFASASAAAAVVFAGNQAGPVVWKIEGTGTTLKEWSDQRMRSAGISTGE